MELERRVETFVRRHHIFSPGSRIVVACSGGPDSLTLASVLLAMRGKWGLELRIAHFEHGIRGAASEADAAFVRDFAEAHGVPFSIVHEDVPAFARCAHLSLETAARERRYAFLEKTAREMGEGALIATGHHAGDQAETVLMHLLRGSGVDGLAGVRPRAGMRIRPLLCVTRAEIEIYCRDKGLTPRTDETNFLLDAARNRIRLEVLPALRRYSPSAEVALCRMAEAEAELADFLWETANAVWGEAADEQDGEWHIRREIYRKQSAAVRKALLRRWAEESGLRQALFSPQYEAMDALFCDGETGKRLTLPDGFFAECRYDAMVLKREEERAGDWGETPLKISGATRIDAIGLTVVASPWEERETSSDAQVAVADADVLRLPIVVRPRRQGDSFLLESGGRQKVKSLLIDRKVPRAFRERVPIFTADGEIFWIGGVRRAAVALTSKETRRAVAFRMIWDEEGRSEVGEYGKGRNKDDDR